MSAPGAGTKRKGRNLIQTKLSFTSTSKPDVSDNQLEKDQLVGAKGTKRKSEPIDLTTDSEMDAEKREKLLEAAEKRLKESSSQRNTETSEAEKQQTNQGNSTASPYFSGPNKESAEAEIDKGQNLAASMSDDDTHQPVGDTLQYSMSDSQDLFLTDSENVNDSQVSAASDEGQDDSGLTKKPSTFDPKSTWKGKALDKLNTAPDCLPQHMTLDKSDNHDICVLLPYDGSRLPKPYPRTYTDKWDNDHVRMPCSDKNEYHVEDKEKPEKRWDLIKKALKGRISGPMELQEAILTYNQRYKNKWKFQALHDYFIHHITDQERREFFSVTLPKMVDLALKMPFLCTKPIPLLKKHKSRKVTLSQQQVAVLLANAFFCTFPRRNARFHLSEYCHYPDINFSNLFQGIPLRRKLEKIKCIINYFTRVCDDMPKGLVTFSRQSRKGMNWSNCLDVLTDLHVSSTGTIEDNGIGMLQVDFANKYLGGGVLGNGCVQEEIRFVICPEMIISRLFTEALEDDEALIMTGCEQFSQYDGYADSFMWAGDFRDNTKRDTTGHLCCEVVAIDALVFRNNYKAQFTAGSVSRELNKAYCGFFTKRNEANKAAVCTGNWGCGAFGGDKQLKSLIQLMAASVAKRDTCYFTFEDDRLTHDLYNVHDLLRRNHQTIADILKLIKDYNKNVVQCSTGKPSWSLFRYITHQLDDVTDSQNNALEGSSSVDDGSYEYHKPRGHHYRTDSQGSPDYKASTP